MSAVLIVDDDPQIRRSLSRLMERQQVRSEAVSTIADAKALIAGHMPTVVLLDVVVGNESGLALHEELRRHDPLAPAVIFMTGRRDLFQRLAASTGPSDDWILKPWDTAELVARVRLVLRRAEYLSRASSAAR